MVFANNDLENASLSRSKNRRYSSLGIFSPFLAQDVGFIAG
jgi:hypothetical protein